MAGVCVSLGCLGQRQPSGPEPGGEGIDWREAPGPSFLLHTYNQAITRNVDMPGDLVGLGVGLTLKGTP